MKRDNYLHLPTYEAGLIQSQAFRAMSNFMSSYLEKYDLSLPEWKLLGHLTEVGEMSPSQIARLLSVKAPIGSRLLKSLEAKSLLIRKSDRQDSRRVYVSPTLAGRRLVKRIEPDLRRELKLFLNDVRRQELAVYLMVLTKLAKKIQ